MDQRKLTIALSLGSLIQFFPTKNGLVEPHCGFVSVSLYPQSVLLAPTLHHHAWIGAVELDDGWDVEEIAMKFASREGATARTLAVTAPGWYAVSAGNGAVVPSPSPHRRTIHSNGTVQVNGTAHSNGLATLSRASAQAFNRGQEVFGPGGGHGLVYIVRTGCIRHYKSLPDGRSINLGLLGPNTVFTQEVDPDGLSSGSSAEALVDSTISVVQADDLAELIRRVPELATAVVHGMSRRLSELQALTEHLLARDTSVRLASTLLSLARGFGRPTADGLTAITLPMTHQTLANMIGSNRVTVTRKLLELQDQGAVRALGRNSIAVSPGKLLAHAQAGSLGDSQEA